MRMLLTICVLVALAGCHRHEPAPANQAEAEAGPVKGVDRSHKGQPVPDVKILDAMSIDMGSTTDLRDLQDGRPLLVNLWASWCAPCVKELPTLQKLRDQRKGEIVVEAISQDSGPQKSVEAFLDRHNLDFVAYQDPKMQVAGALGAEVLPTSILFDAKGREVWRYVGDLDWTSPQAARLLAEAGGARSR
jgi:thiol-disulfide isomerase/thioredoxin